MAKITFVSPDGSSRSEVDAPLGLSVLEIAHRHGIELEGACEGSLACSTCHVIVDEPWFDQLDPPSEEEEDMLDLAFGLTRTSRLGCQIRMTEDLDGLTVTLPVATRNMIMEKRMKTKKLPDRDPAGRDPKHDGRRVSGGGLQAPLFETLKSACRPSWQSFVEHQFVARLADGSLPQRCFRHYLIQDYLFLIHFARAYALAAFKGETLEDVRRAAKGLAAIIDQEISLHVAYCRDWGLSEAAMATTDEEAATMAYTRYVLERGLAGDSLDLAVALAPCILGYAEIGRRLIADPVTRIDGNPYRAWIETYADASYQAVADEHAEQVQCLFDRRGGAARLGGLTTTFDQATRLEAAFWEMGLHPPAGA